MRNYIYQYGGDVSVQCSKVDVVNNPVTVVIIRVVRDGIWLYPVHFPTRNCQVVRSEWFMMIVRKWNWQCGGFADGSVFRDKSESVHHTFETASRTTTKTEIEINGSLEAVISFRNTLSVDRFLKERLYALYLKYHPLMMAMVSFGRCNLLAFVISLILGWINRSIYIYQFPKCAPSTISIQKQTDQ